MAGEVLGAIVAGGGSRRMGVDKALIEVGGATMAQRVVTALASVTPEVVVVGRDGSLAGIPAIPDDRPARRGPLAGLATALRVAEGRAVLLVAVDQPLLRPDTLRRMTELANRRAAIVPVDGEVRQVTCALYPGGWAGEADAEDDSDGSVQSLLDRMAVREVSPAEWRTWGEDGRSWMSVDNPDDVARAEALLAADRGR